MRRQRSDRNQASIVNLYRKLGCEVEIVSQYLSCDLIVGGWGIIDWVEVKDGRQPPSGRKLSDAEKVFQAKWFWVRPVVNVKNQDEVLEHVYRMKGMVSAD